MRKLALTVAVIMVSAASAGCSTVTPSAVKAMADSAPPADPGYTYSAGRATQTFASSAKAVAPAVMAAMDDLRIEGVRAGNDSGMVIFEGTTADHRRASVMLRPQKQGSTRLTTRIGLFGDEPLSRALMDRVGIRLGELPPAPIPAEIPSNPSPNPFINFSRSVGPQSEMLRDMADSRFRDTPVP
jgi:hypothetical protein